MSAVAPDPAPLFRLLREIHAGRRSGHLHLTSGHERRLLRVLSGQIIDGSSDVDGERLGDVLVRYGLLSQGQLEQAVAVVLRDRTKLGRVLGETGLLDRPRLEEAIGLHIREMLFAMVDRVAASFHFEELAESLLEVDVTSRLSTAQLILEATRRVQDPDLVRRVIGNPRRPLAHSEEHVLRAQTITLTPVDGFVLSRIDGTLSARQVLDLIPLPAEEVERSLFGLLCTGLIQPVEMRGATRPDRECQPEAPASGGVAPSAVPAVPRVEGGAPRPPARQPRDRWRPLPPSRLSRSPR